MKVAELSEFPNREQKLKSNEFWEWILWGWSSGWGTKIWWIIGWYAAGLLFFTVIYYLKIDKVKVWRPTENIPMPDPQFGMKLITFPWNYFQGGDIKNKKITNFITALRLSKVLILKIGRRNIYVEGRTLKIFVWLEWAFGYYLLAVLALTLKNTVPIINSLVSQVF